MSYASTHIRILVALTATALFSHGCRSHKPSHWEITAEDGHAVIHTDTVTLVFPDSTVPNSKNQSGGGASGTMNVTGPGSSGIEISTFGKHFTARYARGVNTVTFDGQTFKLLDAGSKLQVGTQEFDLTGKKKTIVIRKDGSAQLQQSN